VTAYSGQLPSLKTLWLRAVAAADLTPREKLVAWAIGQRMDAKARCWPSRATIARDASVHVRTVDRAIAELEAAPPSRRSPDGSRRHQLGSPALLEVSGKRGQRGGVRNRYKGIVPEELWSIFPAALVERLIELGVLGGEGDNGDSPVSVAAPTETDGTSNGDRRRTQRRQFGPATATPVSPEVVEVEELEVGREGPELEELGGVDRILEDEDLDQEQELSEEEEARHDLEREVLEEFGEDVELARARAAEREEAEA
jgi:hypothetical protein